MGEDGTHHEDGRRKNNESGGTGLAGRVRRRKEKEERGKP